MPKFGIAHWLTIGLMAAFAVVVVGGCERFSQSSALSSASELLQNNHPDLAAQVLKKHLLDHPDDLDALSLEFFIFLKTEQFTAATKVLALFPPHYPIVDKALTHPDSEIRGGAAWLISDEALPVDTAHLLHALGDGNPNVRRYCATALGRRRESAALRPLFELLGDDAHDVRIAAIEALGLLADPRTAGWLLEVLNETDPNIRLQATVALRQVVAESNADLLRHVYLTSRPHKQLAIAIALARLRDPVALEHLTNLTTIAEAPMRREWAEALGDYPSRAVTNLLRQLVNDADPSVRQEAERSLERVSDSRGT